MYFGSTNTVLHSLARREEADGVTPDPQEDTCLRVLDRGSLRLVHREAADIDHHVAVLEEPEGVEMDFMPHIILQRLGMISH